MILGRLLGERRETRTPRVFSLPEGLRLYAIGDIHGAATALERLHARIVEDLNTSPPAESLVVYLGDFIDRGPDSRRVIDMLLDPPPALAGAVMLRGNHEQTLLDCVAEPSRWTFWRDFGGAETLLAYGVDGALMRKDADPADAMAGLVARMPPEHMLMIERAPLSVRVGDYFFCHAGVRPGVALARQTSRDLLWIREEFLGHSGDLGVCVVHGHTPNREPEVRDNRINVDTGACVTGVLTCLVLEGETRRFLTS